MMKIDFQIRLSLWPESSFQIQIFKDLSLHVHARHTKYFKKKNLMLWTITSVRGNPVVITVCNVFCTLSTLYSKNSRIGLNRLHQNADANTTQMGDSRSTKNVCIS